MEKRGGGRHKTRKPTTHGVEEDARKPAGHVNGNAGWEKRIKRPVDMNDEKICKRGTRTSNDRSSAPWMNLGGEFTDIGS